jgi:hypothetical protein
MNAARPLRRLTASLRSTRHTALRCAGLHAVVAAGLLVAGGSGAARTFEAEGSDTGAGLGPRHVAMGGTGVATAVDAFATVLNPAGLAEIDGLHLAVSRQLDASLHRLNFAGLAWRLPLPASTGLRATVAAAHHPRIHARATGAFDERDFESLFLRYLLPGLAGTFDGTIDSKTRSTRAALGLAPTGPARWSAGAYVEHIDCRSDFCGVDATSNGFKTQTTGARAVGWGLGLRWRLDDAWTLGVAVSDLRTRLTIDSTTTDVTGTRTSRTAAGFPRKWALGVAWQAPGPDAASTWTADVESTRGQYGKSAIDLRALRLGAEQRRGAWAWRAGAVVPLRIESTETGRLTTPFPFAPTLGLGWRHGPWELDLAVYGHAVMSMHADRPRFAADLGLGLRF